MEWTSEEIEIGKQFYLALEGGQVELSKELLTAHPWLNTDTHWQGTTWIKVPAAKRNIEVMNFLLDSGFNIDALSGSEKTTALWTAVSKEHTEMVKLLLDRGANPNLSRPLINAVSDRKPPELRLTLVRLLVEHGADVNRLYDLYGNAEEQFTLLDWTSDENVIKYLISVGAKSSKEIKGNA